METSKTEGTIHKEMFQPYKVDALKKTLEARAKGGSPYFFRIQVNGVMIVERTSDLAQFDNYQELLPDLHEMIIWVFTNEKTPNYYMKKVFVSEKEMEQAQPARQQVSSPVQQGLSGTDVNTMIEEKLKTEKLSWKYEQLEKDCRESKERTEKEHQQKIEQMQNKLDERDKELEDAEEWIDKLEKRHEQDTRVIEDLKGKNKLKDRDLGNALSGVAEGMLRRNPNWLAKIPGGEELAGLIVEENAKAESPSSTPAEPQGEVTFTKKTQGITVTEEEKRYLSTLQRIEENLPEEHIATVMSIIEWLADNPEKIDLVGGLLDIETKKETKKS